MKVDKKIKKLLTEDCVEILAFLESNSIAGKNQVFETIENQKGVNALEVLILQLSKTFGAFAFSQTDEISIFKNKIKEIYTYFPEFKIIAPIYINEINLTDINENLSHSEAQTQKEQLISFFNDIEDMVKESEY